MRISDWSSDVCSSDLFSIFPFLGGRPRHEPPGRPAWTEPTGWRPIAGATRSEGNLALSVFVTGAAGFIGFHVAQQLLEQGRSVVGLDNMHDYYEIGRASRREGVCTYVSISVLA